MAKTERVRANPRCLWVLTASEGILAARICPSFAVTRPRIQRAQGMPGADTHPRPCVQMSGENARKSYRYAEQSGIPCANGFNGCFVISPVSGLVSHLHLPVIGRLDPSV